MLLQSLQLADKTAKIKMLPKNPALYHALEWPSTIELYLDYLDRFSMWIPRRGDLFVRNSIPEKIAIPRLLNSL